MDAPARSSAPPSSASLCPACRKPVDPLRAGHVAILEGGFRYFCGLACKKAYLGSAPSRDSLDAMTAEPPPVVQSGVTAKETAGAAPEPSFPAPTVSATGDGVAASGERATDAAGPDREGEAVEPPAPEPGDLSEPGASAATEAEELSGATEPAARAEDTEPAEGRAPAAREEAPETLRSPAPSSSPLRRSPATEPTPASASLEAVAPSLAIGAGVLAVFLPLAGESAAAGRLPLALLAALVVVSRAALAVREAAEPSRWVTAAPVAVAAAVTVVARALHLPRVDAGAVFVGLAAAAAMLVEVLVSRARRDVLEARRRTAAALAVRVRRLHGDVPSEVGADEVKPGEQIVVDAGEVIGVDGVIAAGAGDIVPWVDSPAVLSRREGDPVVAGAVVLSGSLRVTATFTGGDRAWLRLAQQTAARIEVAAPLVAFARRSVERGAPVAAAVLAAAAYANNGSWFDVALAACAGGFALAAAAAVGAAALAHARGHVAALRRGVVFKDARAFDVAARADVAVLCSRGTILLGEPEIVAVEAASARGTSSAPADVARVLGIAAGAEMSSSHPFAAAILRAARAKGIRPEPVRSAIGHSGLGVTALSASGEKVIVGSRAFLLQEKVSVAIADARVSQLEAEGRSVLLVAVAGKLVGLLALQDGLRQGARAAVRRMHDARIEPVLLSGEARDTVESIARSLDIEHVRPEILPADRGGEVRALAEGGHVVAALGHAATDDGALGAADVAVAMGAAGAAPGEWGVALASDDVRDAALALTVPRACRERAKLAAVVGAAAQAVVLLAVAFGIAPAAAAPVVGVLAAVAAVGVVREPTSA